MTMITYLKKRFSTEHGATILEVSLTVGLFFAFLALFLWFGITLNARTSLTTSMGSGLHYGVTRGDPRSFGGVGANPDLEGYLSSGCPGNTASPYNSLRLLYRKGGSDTEGVEDFVAGAPEAYALKNFAGAGYSCFTDLPRQYLYSLAAVHQYMRTRVGKGMLNYPCDDRPGCLGCRFLNPDAVGDASAPLDSAPATMTGDLIYMECVYVPDYKGLNPLLSGLMGGGEKNSFQIRRQFYVNRARDR